MTTMKSDLIKKFPEENFNGYYCDKKMTYDVYLWIKSHELSYESIKEELKTEREGNDFYAHEEIYLRGELFYQAVITTDFGDVEKFDVERNIKYQVAGKKAREIISKRKIIL